ncbi:MAG: bifunctional oligoribonuclease/PAP phosphatase NrnA [Sphaerochaeta sp.]|nr:bifunctional oligoribonuclease/PAP phosphatase NrnA [Sphaerochaeta sp.]
MENNPRSSAVPEPFSYPAVDGEIIVLLKDRPEFIVAGHVGPDGDCLSSQFAMAALLQKLGKVVHLANAGPFDRSEIAHLRSDFLTHIDDGLRGRNPVVVVVDCSSPDRLGHLADEIEGLTTLVFDHHSSGEKFGDYRYIVPRSVSTTMIIMHLYKTMGVPIDTEIAEHLFFGLATDSGFFRFLSSYRGETLRMAAELVDLGVSPNAMADRMSGGKSEGYVRYLGKLIDRSESLFGGKLMISSSYLKDARSFTTSDKPSDSLYQILLSIEGVEMVLYFKEIDHNVTEVGMRSAYASPINVGELAESLGGGGHRKASGVTLECSIDEAKRRLIEAAGALLLS